MMAPTDSREKLRTSDNREDRMTKTPLPMTADGMIDYHRLVLDERVHSAVFTHPDVFAEEMRRIFEHWWVYVGHDSEIPEPGDYVVKHVGTEQLIMARSRTREVKLLFNRCRHRGAIVCHRDSGNAGFFRCGYHGWTYRNDGDLVGVPFPNGYGDGFDKSWLGLTEVAQTGTYRGFVFASLRGAPVTFEDYLGRAREGIDMFVDASPTGEIEARAGVTKMEFFGNWKYVGMDGYHPEFTHRSVQDIMAVRSKDMASATFNQYGEQSRQRTIDLGNGHVRLDEQQEETGSLLAFARSVGESDANRQYREMMESAYGPEGAARYMWEADPHMHVWPNLQLTGAHIRVLRPVAPGVTRVDCYPATLKGAPKQINLARIRGHEWFHGPASFGTPDDGEMFERAYQGNLNDKEPWLLFARGLQRETVDDKGTVIGQITDETTDRGRFKQWLWVMTGRSEGTVMPEAVVSGAVDR